MQCPELPACHRRADIAIGVRFPVTLDHICFKSGVIMRAFVLTITLFFSGAAYAQECRECVLADACIKEYARSTSQIKKDYRKGAAELRKGREQTLRDQFSPRMALANQGDLGTVIASEIDKLRDCLGKIR